MIFKEFLETAKGAEYALATGDTVALSVTTHDLKLGAYNINAENFLDCAELSTGQFFLDLKGETPGIEIEFVNAKEN